MKLLGSTQTQADSLVILVAFGKSRADINHAYVEKTCRESSDQRQFSRGTVVIVLLGCIHKSSKV